MCDGVIIAAPRRSDHMTPLSVAGFQAESGVSRETLHRLEIYRRLLIRWQKAINLVGRRSLDDIWRRHFLDSAQLIDLAPPQRGPWLDLGSGAGFPGLVLAILGAADVRLVESDARKCAFLREAARATGTPVTVLRARIEALAPVGAAVITARALAPLARLVPLAARHARPETVGLFLKGAGVDREIQDVEHKLTRYTKCRKLSFERMVSRSDPAGIVLRVGGLIRD